MEKFNPPKTFGVFKPTGHTVIALQSIEHMEAATAALTEQGFTEADIVRYSPQEMVALASSELDAASPLAAFGYEVALVETYQALAESGCNFLVVKVRGDEQRDRVQQVAVRLKVASAQHYGTFVIRDLIGSTAPNALASDVPRPDR